MLMTSLIAADADASVAVSGCSLVVAKISSVTTKRLFGVKANKSATSCGLVFLTGCNTRRKWPTNSGHRQIHKQVSKTFIKRRNHSSIILILGLISLSPLAELQLNRRRTDWNRTKHSLVPSGSTWGHKLAYTILDGLPSQLPDRLQSEQNSAARLIFTYRHYDHVIPLLQTFVGHECPTHM